MGRKRPVSLLKRKAKSLNMKKQKKTAQPFVASNGRPAVADGPVPGRPPVARSPAHQARKHARPGGKRFKPWVPSSVVHRQAAHALGMLVSAAQRGRGGAGIKSLTLAPGIEAKRATHAVTCESLRHLALIRAVLTRTGLLRAHARLTEEVAAVLVYDLLLGQPPRPVGPPERAVLGQQDALQSAMADVLKESGCATPAEHAAAAHRAAGGIENPTDRPAAPRPRAVRVNVLLTSVEDAMAELAAAGHGSVTPDPLLPHVLLLPPGSDLHELVGVAAGRLVLQSRASCMTAAALQPPPGTALLDACAAPGNKTTQLAALLNGRGSVLALDRDERRAARLVSSVRRAGASDCVTVRCADFLTLDPTDHPEIQGILLDPSCSGSGTVVAEVDAALRGAGIVSKADKRGPCDGEVDDVGNTVGDRSEKKEADECQPNKTKAPATTASSTPFTNPRIEALAKFQETALRHALQFPGLQRLAYSTCSVHERENEAVVAAVLPQAEAAGFELAPALPGWHRRGIPGTVPGAECLLRTDPVEDGTDGFFVALFQRKDLDAAWR